MAKENGSSDDEVEESPIEQVRVAVSTTDDPTLPVLSFRAWFLGIAGCVIFSFVSMVTSFRQNPIGIPGYAAQVLLLPLGKLMAAVLPAKDIRIPGTTFGFSLNPGPFNMKEHVMSYMIVSSGLGTPLATDILAAMRAYFGRNINPFAFFLLILTTSNLGYGFAGLFMKFFVDTSQMWWPEVLPMVTLFRTLHEKEEKSKRSLTRMQFFFLVFVLSFSYYIIPGYFFPSVSTLSFVCWIWKRSVTAHQLGSGLNGLGLGSIALDWAAITGFTGNPLVIPFSAIANMMAGLALFMFIVVPIAYWTNALKARSFPISSTEVFDVYGNNYNLSRVLDEKSFRFHHEGYDSYSKVYLSITRVCSLGFAFACLASSFSEIGLFHWRLFWDNLKKAFRGRRSCDVHVKMMKEYDVIPWWWFITMLIIVMGLSIWTCEGFGNQLQLRYWGVLVACLFVLVFLPPFAALRATISQNPEIGFFSHMIIGYLYPGRPLANVAFNSYTTSTLFIAIYVLSSFKLGVYLKIPPKAMFLSQVVGSLINCCVDFSIIWWIFSSVDNMCRPDLLPKGSPWTCPTSRVLYNDMVVWGLVGPYRMFYPAGVYKKLFLSIIAGAAAPLVVWALARAFPEKRWIGSIAVSALLLPGTMIPPAGALNVSSYLIVGFIFNFVVYRKYKSWWSKYNYILSVGLDLGTAAMGVLITLVLQMNGITGVDWWGLDVSDHCPLATCPTERGVQVEGCPVVH